MEANEVRKHHDFTTTHAPIIAAAFIEEHQDVFAEWLENKEIDYGDFKCWLRNMHLQLLAARSIAECPIDVTNPTL
ncbi:hypothetical protein HER14_19350 [Acidithiobacillus thiooxidans]|uniref:hypothetical protein n=1 Tax=Acidithiobacillus thiooxidans TaxID=930 RepID=UPI001C075555|nr:hypothetical protein [Acidithiobacillus thiooxidans]MBU2753022.1 hypothetical protein [Acidithiobacillus thiooxidans]